MFDPERDNDGGARYFYLRLLSIVVISLAVCVALYPSVMGFRSGEDGTTTCIAITSGWYADMSPPTAADLATIEAATPKMLTPEQTRDPELLARFRAEWQAAQARPDTQRANAWINWKNGPGKCVHESRHRLIRSGIGLGAIAFVVAGFAILRRTRPNLRRSHARGAGT